MPVTLQECVEKLQSGDELSWDKLGSFLKGSIALETSAKRRLFDFLKGQNQDAVARGDEDLFEGLVAAWDDEERDPKDDIVAFAAVEGVSGFRLVEIETENFGGLNTFDGPPFILKVDGESWCLEGQNGSGKTSLISAVIWGLTGQRIIEHSGPHPDEGKREPVFDREMGAKTGDWPPLASYPENKEDRSQDARVRVKLTFRNAGGDEAHVERAIVSKTDGTIDVERVAIDPRLMAAPQLVDAGILMPARLAHIGFGDNSPTLYDAVKSLTGLDQLGAIGDGVANYFCHGGRKFLKYDKNNGIDRINADYSQCFKNASEPAKDIDVDLSDIADVRTAGVVENLEAHIEDLTAKASGHAETLADVVADDVDVSEAEGRKKVSDAIVVANSLAREASKRVEAFTILRALHDAHKDSALSDLPDAIAEAEQELETALYWDRKQDHDIKLRLKALASQFYEAPQSVDDLAKCPLCVGDLATSEQKQLQQELQELKAAGKEAERKLDDVCRAIGDTLMSALPQPLHRHVEDLGALEPKAAIVQSAVALFVEGKPFSDVLTGAGGTMKQVIAAKAEALPAFESGLGALTIDATEPDEAASIRELIYELQRILELGEWWAAHRTVFGEYWKDIVGPLAEDETPGEDTVRGQIKIVEDALAASQPYDAVLVQLNALLASAKRWHDIMAVQNKRQAIAEALEPLKALRTFVDAEAARSVDELSDGMAACLDRIRHDERLTFADLDLKKKKVEAFGSLFEDMKINALPIANTSWLKGLLWAFIFALREKAIATYGANPFPLVLLDDPQVTFDPRNKRKWAEELSRLAGLGEAESDAAQIFLTTHERQFFTYITEYHSFDGQQGLIAGVDKRSQKAEIVNGNVLERLYNEALDNNDDARAREYIRQTRIYAEKLLKYMLRGEGPAITESNIDRMRRHMTKLRDETHTAPFTRPVFGELLKAFSGKQACIKFINDASHDDDETIGVAEAKDLSEYWDNVLHKRIHKAFHAYAAFEAHHGDPRMFDYPDNVVALPDGGSDDVRTIDLRAVGGAKAAAATDGRVGDGILTFEDWEQAEPVKLHNHEIYRLTANTLEPVAALGDLIIVSNYAKVEGKHLVAVAIGDRLLARRFQLSDVHRDMGVFTAQAVNPYQIEPPIIVPHDGLDMKKIVGTLFVGNPPAEKTVHELEAVKDPSEFLSLLENARLYQVDGQSAEPIALHDQYLIVGERIGDSSKWDEFNGRLVIAYDADGASYFKRMRAQRAGVYIMESLNPNGMNPAELLSADGRDGIPQLAHILPVLGVLFDRP